MFVGKSSCKVSMLAVIIAMVLIVAAGVLVTQTAAVYADEYEDEGDYAITLDVAGTLKKGMNTKYAQTVRFGRNSWYTDEDLIWHVIGYGTEEGSAAGRDGCITMINSKIMNQYAFDDGDICEEYPLSLLREWLGWFSEGFDEIELDSIREGIDGIEQGSIYEEEDPYLGGIGKLWLLSDKEAELLDINIRAMNLCDSADSNKDWWLRGEIIGNDASFVDRDGNICKDDFRTEKYIRPAVNIDQSKVLFLSQTVNGKLSGDDEDPLGDVYTGCSGDWKFTLKDDRRDGFKAELKEVDKDLKYVEFTYSGAITDTGSNYVSAMIVTKEGNVKCYGRIKDVSQNEGEPSGTLRLNIDGKYEAGDSIYVFNEQCMWGNHTDWSSPLRELDISTQSVPDEQGDPDKPSPENNWHEPVLKPGETYNCSDAGWNTTVYINKPGSYTLKGESTHVRVVINSSDVKLYLADGLNLDCGATTYVGSRSAAINVDVEKETGGTITLISKKNAYSYFEGYMAPAIWKAGTKTKLVFATEDPGNPGTIEAKGGLLSAGIGGICYAVPTAATTGNMEFNSGNIIATGSDSGAGIGGGSFGGAENLVFNGGNIKAYGGSTAAGIGGGNRGDVKDIIINGGTVLAENQNDAEYAAAIGSGNASNTAENIVINDGSIFAVNRSGVGIGAGGEGGTLKSLIIKGGTVRAQNKTDWAPGLGAAHNGTVENITIEGGIVNAEGGTGAPGIGVHGEKSDQKLNVTIKGGAVRAVRGGSEKEQVNYDIGMGDGVPSENVNVTITGGSLLADRVENAKDDKGRELHRIDVGFDGVATDGLALGSAVFSDSSFKYGLDGTYTNNGGKAYFWLPSLSDTLLKSVTVDGKTYEGVIRLSSSQGTLRKAGSNDDEGYMTIKFKFVNKSATIARLYVHDTTKDNKEWYSDSCNVGENDTVKVKMKRWPNNGFNIFIQVWCFGWYDAFVYQGYYFFNDGPTEFTITACGNAFTISSEMSPDPFYGGDILKKAAIKASRKTVKKGRKTTVKVTSDSGAKLTAAGRNAKAKKALKKKYVKITNGKTVKITFTKKAPKGKYTFKVTSPAKGIYKKTTKTITVKVA